MGLRVTLVEKRPFLGGRAYSFVDPETGQEVDNGQHVFLGCCTEYIGFLRGLGVLERTALQKRLHMRVVDRQGRAGALYSVPWLPSPFHLLPSFLTYRHLGLMDKLRALSALLRIKFTDRERRREILEGQTFLEWLERHGQTSRAVRHFWDLIVTPTLNDSVGAVSAYMAFMIFQEGLLRGRHNADIGYSRVGLTALISDAARSYIESRGGTLLLDRSVVSMAQRDGRLAAVELPGGDWVEGDVFVGAVPWDALPKLLPLESAGYPSFAFAEELEASPIVGLHLWYDRPVMEEEFVAFVDSPVQWVFNKSRIQGLPGPGQYLCVSLSGAWEHAPKSKEELRREFTEELAHLFARAREARIERFIVVKQLAATFRSIPGAEAHRPPQTTPLPNLFLAGDWTQTGWPSTMESAVRSGLLAAREVARWCEGEAGERTPQKMR